MRLRVESRSDRSADLGDAIGFLPKRPRPRSRPVWSAGNASGETIAFPGSAIASGAPAVAVHLPANGITRDSGIVETVVSSIRSSVIAGEFPVLGSTSVTISLERCDRWLVQLHVPSGAIAIDGPAFSTLLSDSTSEGSAIAAAVVGTGLARFGRVLDSTRVSAERSSNAQDLRNLFRSAFPYFEEVRSFIARETDPAATADGDLTMREGEALVDLLCSESEWDRTRAEAYLIRRGDLRLVPVLEDAYRCASSSEGRAAIVRSHRSMGRRMYTVQPSRALVPVRRSTAGQRLARIDAVVCDLLSARSDRQTRSWLGVDTAALGRATDRSPAIVDEGASDGITSLDLALAIARDTRIDNKPRVISADVGNAFYVWRDAVFDSEGGLLQVVRDGVVWSQRAGGRPTAPGSLRERLEDAFAALTSDARSACRVPWVTPAAAEYARENPGRLSFATRNLFHRLPDRVAVIRAFTVLYRQIRAGADISSYYDKPAVRAGLEAIGCNLVPGGVAVIGSVVDHRDLPTWFVDYEIWQRSSDRTGKTLLLRRRFGKGLGVDSWRVDLPS